MRRLDTKPYSLIVPVHVERLLRGLNARAAAKRIRDELQIVAEDLGRSPPPWRETWIQTLVVERIKVEYECDPVNRAVIALDVIAPDRAR